MTDSKHHPLPSPHQIRAAKNSICPVPIQFFRKTQHFYQVPSWKDKVFGSIHSSTPLYLKRVAYDIRWVPVYTRWLSLGNVLSVFCNQSASHGYFSTFFVSFLTLPPPGVMLMVTSVDLFYAPCFSDWSTYKKGAGSTHNTTFTVINNSSNKKLYFSHTINSSFWSYKRILSNVQRRSLCLKGRTICHEDRLVGTFWKLEWDYAKTFRYKK